jgi:hypothetical protein
MPACETPSREWGQASVEWIALLLIVSAALTAALAVAGRIPAAALARAIGTRLICAADLTSACSANGALVDAYGPDLAAAVQNGAPEIDYESGMAELPVDFRSCRARRCGEGPDSGPVWASDTGERATAFVHVVDCRTHEARVTGARRRYDCSGPRAGNAYIQYWLYYRDSATSPWSDLPGGPGLHRDDWESYQIRLGPGGTDARATSHQGYDYRGGPVNWPSDAGVISKSAWGSSTGRLYVSDGSHAGHVYEPRRLAPARGLRTAGRAGAMLVAAAAGRRPRSGPRRPRVSFTAPRRPTRWTPAARLRLVPIEGLDAPERRTGFAIVPPWRKPVYRDPEDEGT